jgi:hypothetical protein
MGAGLSPLMRLWERCQQKERVQNALQPSKLAEEHAALMAVAAADAEKPSPLQTQVAKVRV